MAKSEKVIISCAVTGAIHTPSMTPHLPITPAEIADDAIGAARAGAAILHLHAREPATGKPSSDPEIFKQFLPQIAAECEAVVNITTGGGLGMSMEERLAAALWAKPELASMNMGSFNFNISGAANRIDVFKHAWEKPYLEMTTGHIMPNTFDQIRHAIELLSANGTRFEFECYDVGHLYNLAHIVDQGLVEPPFFVQSIFGILGGISTQIDHLQHMRATANRLFGDDYVMSVLGAGRHQMRFATVNAIEGGHVRVGLEDSIYIEKGKLAESNAQQVSKIIRILNELSLEPASPAEARQMLGLKGRDQVAF